MTFFDISEAQQKGDPEIKRPQNSKPQKSWWAKNGTIVVLLFIMWVTNPSIDEFANSVSKQAFKGSILESGLAQNFGTGVVKLMTTTSDYKFFSIFTVNTGVQKVKYIGFIKVFFIRI